MTCCPSETHLTLYSEEDKYLIDEYNVVNCQFNSRDMGRMIIYAIFGSLQLGRF